jgi:LysR family transcriptional activator of nhaA
VQIADGLLSRMSAKDRAFFVESHSLMPHLNFHHLRLFHAIAHQGSLSKAAAYLNLSQSAISVQVQKLEDQLGHNVFERRGKRLILTEAGRIALDYADTIFETGRELLNTLQGRSLASVHLIRVGALTTLSRNFLMGFLRPLIGRQDVAIVIRSGTLAELVAELESHRLDVVLANTSVRRESDAVLHSYLLDQQAVSLVSRPRPGAPPFRFPDDLRHEPVLLPGGDSDIRHAFDRVMAIAGIRPTVLAEVDDMAMLRLLARDSPSITLVPPIVVKDELEAGLLTELCQISEISERFYAIVQSRRFPSPLLADLLPGFQQVEPCDAEDT